MLAVIVMVNLILLKQKIILQIIAISIFSLVEYFNSSC